MCLSVFYSQVIGIWLFLVGLAMLVDRNRFKKATIDGINHPAINQLYGFVGLVAGLLIVVTHNIWVMEWPVVITIVGWFVLLWSILRIFCAESFGNWVKGNLTKDVGLGLKVWSWIWLIIGLYLIWAGFKS